MEATYPPNPIATDDVEVSLKITALSELISENVHDVWATSRMTEGWIYGAERNDTLKMLPCLVPYNELPEAEKEYDDTALQTLRLILKLGFTIQKQKR